MIKQKILVVGDFTTRIRSQQFIQKILQKDLGQKFHFTISICNPNTYKANNKLPALVRYFIDKLLSILFFIELLIKIPLNDKILFLAMNHRYFPALLLANTIWRRPIIADMYISIYDALKSRDQFNGAFLKRLATFRFEWYYKYLDRLIIERPSQTIYNGDLEFKLISNLVNADINKSNYVIIPTSALTKLKINPSPSEVFRICWWGTFMPFHGVDTIIKAARFLKESGVSFTLNLFGTPKNDTKPYEILVNDLQLSNYVFFHTDKTFTNCLLEKYLHTNCDLAFGNFSDSERAFRIFPTKIIDSFSMNIPVLTMATEVIGDGADINNDLFTCTNEPLDICAEVIKIINNPNEKERRANNGFALYETFYSEDMVQKTFISLFGISN
ncbi:glycosyltransferase [Flavobacteriaceae bacterium]|nr:glycosyltransferase [Flavobacteriaceae bacterium]